MILNMKKTSIGYQQMLSETIETNIDVRPYIGEIEYVCSEVLAYNEVHGYKDTNLWLRHTGRQKNIKFHEHTQQIKLIGQVVTTESQPNTLETKDVWPYPDLWQFTEAFLDDFGQRHNCTAVHATYVKLFPGKKIAAHIDLGKFYAVYDRYHLVLTGSYTMCMSPDFSKPETFLYEAGNVYTFNNRIKHSVVNGLDERVALIFDTKRNG